MSKSRSSARNPRVVSAAVRDSGHAGARSGSARWPASRSRKTTSCSGPLNKVGAGSPRKAASARKIAKPNAWLVRAIASVVVPPIRVVTASRNRAAPNRVGANSRHSSARHRPALTAAATNSTASVVLPVPGPPTTRSNAASQLSAARAALDKAGVTPAEGTDRRNWTMLGIPSRTSDSLLHPTRRYLTTSDRSCPARDATPRPHPQGWWHAATQPRGPEPPPRPIAGQFDRQTPRPHHDPRGVPERAPHLIAKQPTQRWHSRDPADQPVREPAGRR